MEEIQNVFVGKTVEEATEAGLKALGLTREEADVKILEEGKKRLFGSVKAKVQVTKKVSDAQRAADFVDGLLELLGVTAVSEIVSEEDNIKIDIKTTTSARVIGKRGDILDAIQCMAGAVANIGRDEYKKVVVDCENYREQREETLKGLAEKLARKAVEKGRKMSLEPMSPYERRIIHSALAGNTEVKTLSEGREPNRYIVVIPNNAKPFEKRNGYRKPYGDKRQERGDAREEKAEGERKPYGERRERRDNSRRDDRRGGSRPAGGGAKRGKKQIYFGTFLGNSNANAVQSEETKQEDKDGE